MKVTQKLTVALASITMDKLLAAIKERVTEIYENDAKAGGGASVTTATEVDVCTMQWRCVTSAALCIPRPFPAFLIAELWHRCLWCRCTWSSWHMLRLATPAPFLILCVHFRHYYLLSCDIDVSGVGAPDMLRNSNTSAAPYTMCSFQALLFAELWHRCLWCRSSDTSAAPCNMCSIQALLIPELWHRCLWCRCTWRSGCTRWKRRTTWARSCIRPGRSWKSWPIRRYVFNLFP